MPIEMQSVQSSHVWRIGYDPETRQLAVHYIPSVNYPSGRIVTFADVPPDTAAQVVPGLDPNAEIPSVGGALNAVITGKFEYR